MRERIAFQTNVPVTVALAYADGLPVEGRFGDQILYTLSDERVMYVPPVVRTKLIELGIQPREPFTICKAERRRAPAVHRMAGEEREQRRRSAVFENPAGERPNQRAWGSETTEWTRRRVAPAAGAHGEHRCGDRRRAVRGRERLLGEVRKRGLARHGAQPFHPGRARGR